MHLESVRDQPVRVQGRVFDFRREETIHTENSYKFTMEGFAALTGQAGWRLERYWRNEEPAFAVVLLRAESGMRDSG
jgi:uncharacterized SAM-dependent methyltransferase